MNKNRFVLRSSIATAFCALLGLAFTGANAQDAQPSQDSQPPQTQGAQPAQNQDTQPAQNYSAPASAPASADGVAAQMVPADAVLLGGLDSRTTKPGQQFQASLTSKVELKNGPELPKGTILVGTIATDDTQSSGGSKLALRFTQANLKDGKSVPISATIVGIAPPEDGFATDKTDEAQPPMDWNGTSTAIDQVGALSGVDLHSRIAGENSGVFVAPKKTDMKLAANCRISLAIGLQSAPTTSGGY